MAPPWPQRAVLAAALLVLAVVALAPSPVPATLEAGRRALLVGALEAFFTGLVGERGPALLGVLSLALAALIGCRSLERRIGAQAPLLVALLIFGSAAWALTLADGAALAPLALSVLAFGLAYEAQPAPAPVYRPPEPGWRGLLRFLAVGLLLAELLPSSPLLAGLLIPAALAVPRERRRSRIPALLGGFAMGMTAELAAGGMELFTGPIALAAESAHSEPMLIVHGLLGLVAGRHVGLLAGFAPALLLLGLGRRTVARPALAATCLVLPVVEAVLLPFDFASGWIHLSFLPLYGALWHLPVRPPRAWHWGVVVLLCGLACWPLWLSPRATASEAGTRLAGAWPRGYLPYESTLRRLPNTGEVELPDEGLWVRIVGGGRALGEGRFEISGPGPATIWLAGSRSLRMVALELGPGAPSSFEVAGATAGRTVFRPDGRVGFEVLLSRPRGTHRLWLDDEPRTSHLIEVRLPAGQGGGPRRFRLLASAQPQAGETTKDESR